jgi:hypothetical protein
MSDEAETFNRRVFGIDDRRASTTGHTIDPEGVDHPKHYNVHPSGIECIDVVEHMSFNIGNAVKYLWREGEKGYPVKDMKKAVWYIQREIAKREKQAAKTGE